MHASPARSEFVLHTEWVLETDIERVWMALRDVERWPQWWRYVREVIRLQEGDADGLGAVHRFTWGSRLPYRLSFDLRITEVRRPSRVAGVAFGDLDGRGTWTLSHDGAATCTHYEWRVDLGKPWMRAVAPLARPLFAWNHNEVMQEGGRGLARHLGVRRIA